MEPPEDCQLHRWPEMNEGRATGVPQSLPTRVKMVLKRRLSPTTKRRWKKRYDRLAKRLIVMSDRGETAEGAAPPVHLNLQTGDRVRIRTKEEIMSTVDSWRELRGCGFMEEMEPFCGTEQRVLKPVRQFLDERDYNLKKARGIVLLEGLMCQGTRLYGPCDRSCFFFWREEWLERIEE